MRNFYQKTIKICYQAKNNKFQLNFNSNITFSPENSLWLISFVLFNKKCIIKITKNQEKFNFHQFITQFTHNFFSLITKFFINYQIIYFFFNTSTINFSLQKNLIILIFQFISFKTLKYLKIFLDIPKPVVIHIVNAYIWLQYKCQTKPYVLSKSSN